MGKRIFTVVIIAVILFVFVAAENVEDETAARVTELEKKLQEVTGKEKIDTLNLLILHLCVRSPGKAIEYGNRAIALAEKIKYPKGKANAFFYLARAYGASGDDKKPFEFTRAALNIYESLGDKNSVCMTLIRLAEFYQKSGNYDEALKYELEALKTAESNGDKSLAAESSYMIGRNYIRIGDNDKALEYFQQAVKTGREAGNIKRTAYYLNTIAITYAQQKKYAPALETYREVLTLFNRQGDQYGTIMTLINIGLTYGELKNYHESFKYLKDGLKVAEDTGNKDMICRILLMVGNNYSNMKDYKQAITSYNDALKTASAINEKLVMETIYEKLSDVFAASGDYQGALDSYKRFTAIKDEMVNEEKNKQIALLQEQFEAEKKDKEIEILTKTNKIRSITRNVFIAGFILTFVALIFIFKKYLYLFAFWKKQKYIGQYRLLEPIGSGGMGNVFKAHGIREKNTVVAIKILKEELFKVESNRIRFRHEGAIIDKLNHPNILKIYERGVHEDRLYFVMEFIEGITLEKRIQIQGRLDINVCYHIMIQVADALAMIHGKNIVHRDLKPANIMLTEKDGDADFVKLLDFGLSKMKYQTQITESGFLVGTINYLAPEQIVDFEYSPASDIYSLGIIFYEMVVGGFVFAGDSVTTIVEHILDKTPPPPNTIRPDIPEPLNRLIVQMISKQNHLRPTAQTVLDTLKELSRS